MSSAIVRHWCLCGVLVAATAAADHGPENILPVSRGVYRLPFADGIEARVGGDHITHRPHNRLDISSRDNAGFTNELVAPADGWLLYVQDGWDVNCPSATCSYTCAEYSGPASGCCLRGTPGCNTCDGGAAGCQTTCRNNYVFIFHPGGEISKLSHVQAGSVTANGWEVGDWIENGEVVGLEGDVGQACGVHLHFEIGFFEDLVSPPDFAAPDYDPLDINPDSCVTCGFPNGSDDDEVVISPSAIRQNRIPVFCQQPFPLRGGETYTAGPCDGQCTSDTSQLFATVPDDHVFFRQVTDTMIVAPVPGFHVEGGAGASIRAGTRVTLGPGFTAENGAYFSAAIGGCDRPGF